MNEAIQLIPVLILAGMVFFLAVLLIIDRKQHQRWINDLHLKLLARDVPEYVNAMQGLKIDPELMSRLEEQAEEQEYANYQDRVPVG
jgi:hypothetical protein